MSVGQQLHRFQDFSQRALKSLIDVPLHHLFGGRGRSTGAVAGVAPDALVIASDAAPTRLALWRITQDRVEAIEAVDEGQIINALAEARQGRLRLWLDVSGFADDALLRRLGECFEIPSPMLADLINIERHNKLDIRDERILVLIQALHATSPEQPTLGQIGLYLHGAVLVTFRERHHDLFGPVLARLNRSGSRMRSSRPDYLACALIDMMIDANYPVIESLADRVDEAEDQVINARDDGILAVLHQQRRGLIALARLFWRQRDVLARLLREPKLLSAEATAYLRDIHERAVALMDMAETTRDLAGGLLDLHLSLSANRANQIMQVLTIMASIFIPLTFIAGIYGMNFQTMPELAWAWGYPLVLALMLVVALALVGWFYRRGWIGIRRKEAERP